MVWPGFREGGQCSHRGGLDRRDDIEQLTRFGEMVRATRGTCFLDEFGNARPEQRGFGEQTPSLLHEVRARLTFEKSLALRQEVSIQVAEQCASGPRAFHHRGDDGEIAAGVLDPVEPRLHALGSCADSSATEVGDRRR